MNPDQWEDEFDELTDKIVNLRSICPYRIDMNISCVDCSLRRKCKVLTALANVAMIEF